MFLSIYEQIKTSAWPGLPAGVKFDPTDREILEHLEAKLGVNKAKPPHPYIDVFIPTLDGENGIYYTHPERLPGKMMNRKHQKNTPIMLGIYQNIPISYWYLQLLYLHQCILVFF